MFDIKTRSSSRLQSKLDKILWFALLVAPLVAWLALFVNYHGTNIPDIFTYVTTFSPFTYIDNLFGRIFESVFGSSFGFVHYVSYMAGIEICHVLFDIIVFIPRFCHQILDKAINFGD